MLANFGHSYSAISLKHKYSLIGFAVGKLFNAAKKINKIEFEN